MTRLRNEAFGDAVVTMRVRSALVAKLLDQHPEMTGARLAAIDTAARVGRNETPERSEMAHRLCREHHLRI